MSFKRVKEPKVTVNPSYWLSDWRVVKDVIRSLKENTLLKQVPEEVWDFFSGVEGCSYDTNPNEIVLGGDSEPSIEALTHALSHEYLHFLFTKKWNDKKLSDALDDIRFKHPELATII